MEESAKKYTPGSNLAKMSPEELAALARLDESLKYAADYLKRNVLREEAEFRPLTEAEQKLLDEVTEKLNKFEASRRGGK
jgi:hypothetical protein